MRAWQILSSGSSPEKNSDVIITIRLDGRDIVGPITGQNLAIIAKYGGYGKTEDILQHAVYADGHRVECFIQYTETVR